MGTSKNANKFLPSKRRKKNNHGQPVSFSWQNLYCCIEEWGLKSIPCMRKIYMKEWMINWWVGSVLWDSMCLIL